jgi:hypothetical protein
MKSLLYFSNSSALDDCRLASYSLRLFGDRRGGLYSLTETDSWNFLNAKFFFDQAADKFAFDRSIMGSTASSRTRR